MKDINTEAFSTRSRVEGSRITVAMKGNADMTIYEQLKTFLDSLHDHAQTLRTREAVFEIQELYFMNSSCLSLILRLVNAIRESSEPRRYALRIHSNPNLRWQRRSLEAVRSYASEIVSVD